jgi:hypothetical protein
VIASTTDAVMLFSDIGQMQKMCEGTRNGQCPSDGHVAQQRRDVLKSRQFAGLAGLLRGLADALDSLKERLTFVLAKHLAKEFPEQPHIVSQRLMWVDGHPADLMRAHFRGLRHVRALRSCNSVFQTGPLRPLLWLE